MERLTRYLYAGYRKAYRNGVNQLPGGRNVREQLQDGHDELVAAATSTNVPGSEDNEIYSNSII